MKRRVVISGLGIYTALGATVEEFWQNALAGNQSIEPIPEEWRKFHTFRSSRWSPLPLNHLSEFGITRVDELRSDAVGIIAWIAAKQAAESAKLPMSLGETKDGAGRLLEPLDAARAGVFWGTGVGGVTTLLACHANHILSPAEKTAGADIGVPIPKRFNPYAVPMVMPNTCAGNVAARLGIRGPSRAFCAACASGTLAVGAAFNSILSGEVDLALAGGSEYLHEPAGSLFRSFDGLGALAQGDGDEINCPFDERHTGFLFSQGGSAGLILEEEEHALRRSAPILARVTGFCETTSPGAIVAMDQAGTEIKRMIGELLRQAELKPSDIDYINTHGTGTPLNDGVEAALIDSIFGKKPLLNSTKSLLGHSLGASGAIEAVVSILSLRDGTTHASRNLSDPIRDLNFVRTVEPRRIKNVISQSFAFGGHNTGLLFSHLEA